MSVRISGFVWDSKLPRDMKFVALANADHANHDGGSVYPGRQTVAEMTGYSRRSVELITASLVKAGILLPDGVSELNTRRYKFSLKALADYRPPGWKETGGEESSGAKILPGGGEENRTEGGEESSPKPSIRKPVQKSINGMLFVIPSNSLPPPLNVPEVQDLWDMWQEHLRQRKKKLSEEAARMQVAKLKAIGVERAIAALKHSIENNYTGLFEPRQASGGRPTKAPTDYKAVTKENVL